MSGLEMIAAASAALGAAGTIAQGVSAKNAADYQADQQEAAGKEAFAASQREAIQKRKEAEIANSRAQAVAAASGAGASDPTIIKLMTDTAGQGELNAQGSLFQGEQQKRGLFDAAKGSRMSGNASLFGSFLGAGGEALGGFAKYRQNKLQYG